MLQMISDSKWLITIKLLSWSKVINAIIELLFFAKKIKMIETTYNFRHIFQDLRGFDTKKG